MVYSSLFFKLLFYAALGAISTLAFLPNYDALPPLVNISDLLNHAVAFITLFILLKMAHPKLKLTYHLSFLLAYALWIEAVQYFLPTRFATWSDVLADSVGILIGYAFYKLFYYFNTKHLQKS